ncbi:hypothetical protein [Halobacterium sp. BOL4-2]|uniref:hypothetical protein n=1 Tax=Halobacterium sp. BOL4-2 TaxID=2810537 RepID=UPI00196503F0|nr:hypothetical protein [Halobacterium sp. BOL4-2]QRY26343.1 hypothetical protein JRZ79_12990 [Halobacterium sp. BOL4-2]
MTDRHIEPGEDDAVMVVSIQFAEDLLEPGQIPDVPEGYTVPISESTDGPYRFFARASEVENSFMRLAEE